MKPISPTVFLLALRFLYARSADGFLSMISWISILGVSLGVIALIVVTSVINGFESELTRVISGMNGNVVVYTRGQPFSILSKTAEKIQQTVPDLEAMSGSFVTELMISGPEGVAGAVLDGFEPESLAKATTVPQQLLQGRMAREGAEVVLGYLLAEKLGAKLGHTVKFIAPVLSGPSAVGESTAAENNPLVFSAEVVGILKMGMYQYDSKFAFVPLDFVQETFKQEDRITTYKLKLPDDTDSFKTADRLTENLGYPFRAKNWGQLNKNLFYAIELEKVVIAIILSAIIIVAAFNLISALMMMTYDKAQEISILKAMGMNRAKTFQIFCLIGMIIGGLGVTFGVVGGLLLNQVIKSYRWIDLPADIYHIDFLPVLVRWSEIGMILVFSFVICWLATVIPSLEIARRSPVDGLRYEA